MALFGHPEMDGQDLGSDFVFESDPRSLQRILDNRELSPNSVLALRNSKLLFQKPSFTPAKNVPMDNIENLRRNYDFFEGQNGAVFYRPKSVDKKKNLLGSGCKKPRHHFGQGRLEFAKPVRPPVTSSSLSAKIANNVEVKNGKKVVRRSCLAAPMRPWNRTEKKPMPFLPPPPRQSISERKAIPGLDGFARIAKKPQIVKVGARKELDFEKLEEEENKDFEFAKPKAPAVLDKKSLAKAIMMRESLAGLPRASLSGLFRQSLSLAELDRMFEDDSTQSFEDLERRLKTPSKPKTKSATSTVKDTTDIKDENRNEEQKDEKAEQKIGKEEQKVEKEVRKIEKEEQKSEQDKKKPVSKLAVPTLVITQEDGEEIDFKDCKFVEYEIEDSALEDQAVDKMMLQRSLSNLELATPSKRDTPSQSLLVKSTSTVDLTDETVCRDITCDFLKAAVKDLERHRQQQAEIDRQIQELMTQSKKRREEFKVVWGVSPKSINQKRTVKIALNVQDVSFSHDQPKNNEEDDEIQSDFGQDDMFGPEAPVEDEEDEEESELEKSAIFQEYIEANFVEEQESPPKLSLDDVLVDPLNVEGFVQTLHPDADLQTPEVPCCDEDEDDGDKLEMQDMDMDSPLPCEQEEEEVGMSLFAAARAFKMEMEKERRKSKIKSVRFLTPSAAEKMNKNEQEMVQSSKVQVSIGNIVSQKGAVGVHTPMPKQFMKKVLSNNGDSEEEFYAAVNMPTPMALRDISKRAQESLAELYNCSSTEELDGVQPQKLFF